MKHLPPILTTTALLLLLLAGYAGAYLGMEDPVDEIPDGTSSTIYLGVQRTYNYEWASTVFAPAVWIESKVRGREVRAVYREPRISRHARP